MRRLALLTMLGLGCRPQGLPAEPAGADATDPGGPAPAAPKARRMEASAFEGVKLDGGGHAHHGHGKKKEAAQ